MATDNIYYICVPNYRTIWLLIIYIIYVYQITGQYGY